MDSNQKEILVDLLRKAIDGNMTFEQFRNEWNSLKNESTPLLDILYQDIEDAVCHCPGYFTRSGIDQETWSEQYERGVVLCDYYLLLNSKLNAPTWIVVRKKVLKSVKSFEEKHIKEWVEIILSQTENGFNFR